jgi:mono/diheme cytochrome c family protein
MMYPSERSALPLAIGLCVLALVSCKKPYQEEGWATQRITQDYTFPVRDDQGNVAPAGRTVSAHDLNRGRESYIHYCYACHGVHGDGNGPAAIGLRPPPRDFRVGSFKFAAVKEGLPNDWDFFRIIKGGLHGSAMLEWDIPDSEIDLIVQFIKTFPPLPCDPKVDGEAECQKQAQEFPEGKPNVWVERFQKDQKFLDKPNKMKGTGEPILVPEVDPWAGKAVEAIEKGKELYHLKAQCVSCHPSYLTNAELTTLAKADVKLRDDVYFGKVILAKDNPYKVNIMPPDFTMVPLRSIREHERDASGNWVDLDPVRELWRLIASGIGGTGMPSWKDSIKDDEIWAIAHYIKSLMDLRLPENREALQAMRTRLNKQPPAKPAPPPPPEPPAPAPEPAASASASASASSETKEAPAPSASAKASAAPKAPPKAPPKPPAPAP